MIVTHGFEFLMKIGGRTLVHEPVDGVGQFDFWEPAPAIEAALTAAREWVGGLPGDD